MIYKAKNIILIFIILVLVICSCENSEDIGNYSLTFINDVVEVDPNFLILKDKSFVFLENRDSIFQLYKYKNNKIKKINISKNSVFNPFLIKGRIVVLSDFNGDENFKVVPNLLEKYLNGKYIKKIFSFNNGYYIIYQKQDLTEISFINLITNKKNKIFRYEKVFNGMSYSQKGNFFVFSYDDHLIYYDIRKNKSYKLTENIEGRKISPFIYNNSLFFINNYYSEYFAIYTLDLNKINSRAKIFYKTKNDLKLPKYDGKYLYFIEIINNEYLLKRKNYKTGIIEKLTNKGVVYNYDFLDSKHLIISYSDFNTPRSINIFNIKNKYMKNISGNTINIEAEYLYFRKNKYMSAAYEFYPTLIKKIKGIILFFHPGLNSDFSPRWDTILMTLVENGYKIYAPNYPMSFGYGKSYALSDFKSAVMDMIKWKKYLKRTYPNKSLYLMSASSGNIIMENVLASECKDVNASVSLFGLIGTKPNSKTLYVLGKNDPYVNYKFRINQLKEAMKNKIELKVVTYKNEGHWFRRKKNIKNAVVKILNYFENNK